jgi:hypothetical protein
MVSVIGKKGSTQVSRRFPRSQFRHGGRKRGDLCEMVQLSPKETAILKSAYEMSSDISLYAIISPGDAAELASGEFIIKVKSEV